MPDPRPRVLYGAIAPLSRCEAAEALNRDQPSELLYVVLSVALHEPDGPWAEQFCRQLSTHSHANVRGNALLGLGHIARIHRSLDVHAALAALRNGLADPDEFVRGQAESALDDVRLFLNVEER